MSHCFGRGTLITPGRYEGWIERHKSERFSLPLQVVGVSDGGVAKVLFVKPLKKLAFVVNTGKPGAMEYAHGLRGQICQTLETCTIHEGDALEPGFLEGMDACCVIGGDGTILNVVAEAVSASVPVMGVNYGNLGFLTTYTRNEAQSCLPNLIAGDYEKTHRSLLECRTANGETAMALNDVVVKSGSKTGLIHLRVRKNGLLVNNFSSDGLLFSTPTGSTAYNLAAGGPIMHPAAEAIAMTPISPHTLSNRSVVFSSKEKLTVDTIQATTLPQVSLDGRYPLQQFSQDSFPLEISVSEKTFTLIHQVNYEHFAIVRSKLKW